MNKEAGLQEMKSPAGTQSQKVAEARVSSGHTDAITLPERGREGPVNISDISQLKVLPAVHRNASGDLPSSSCHFDIDLLLV